MHFKFHQPLRWLSRGTIVAKWTGRGPKTDSTSMVCPDGTRVPENGYFTEYLVVALQLPLECLLTWQYDFYDDSRFLYLN